MNDECSVKTLTWLEHCICLMFSFLLHSDGHKCSKHHFPEEPQATAVFLGYSSRVVWGDGSVLRTYYITAHECTLQPSTVSVNTLLIISFLFKRPYKSLERARWRKICGQFQSCKRFNSIYWFHFWIQRDRACFSFSYLQEC